MVYRSRKRSRVASFDAFSQGRWPCRVSVGTFYVFGRPYGDHPMNASASRWCVLIPCLNEEAAIGRVINSVLALNLQVIVVDDGSTDRTIEIVQQLPVTLLRPPQRMGKGEALRTGFREALR